MARNRDSEYKRVTEAMGLCAPYTATYVLCSLHFVGENGPPAEYLDPTSAFLSTEHVSLYYNMIVKDYMNYWDYVNAFYSFLYCVNKMCMRVALYFYINSC